MQNRIDTLEDKLVNMATAKDADVTPKQPEETVVKAPEKNDAVKEDVKVPGNSQTFFDEIPVMENPYKIPVFISYLWLMQTAGLFSMCRWKEP